MHALLAGFIAMVFALGHAAPAPATPAFSTQASESVSFQVPNRRELAQAEYASSYAGSACLSCRRTNTTSLAR